MGDESIRNDPTVEDQAPSERFGIHVRGLRRERGLTLEGLAERSGVSRAMISKLERGEKNPTLVVAAKVAEGLGVTLSQLVAVEKGRLRADIGGEEYLLEEGDALYFEADVSHRFDNIGDGECSYYLVIVSKGT